jgi:hypothetical protein
VLAVLLCILLVWMLRHWFRRSGNDAVDDGVVDEAEPRRRRLPWK